MRVRHLSYENYALWIKSLELLNLVSSAGALKDIELGSQLELFKDTAKSINEDIRKAYLINDPQIILYHFSKAKSSCLILKEILPDICQSLPEASRDSSFEIINDLRAMLNNYIHLCRINIIIEVKEKKNKI